MVTNRKVGKQYLALIVTAAALFLSGCAHDNAGDPKRAQVAYDLGATNLREGRYREALHNFEQATTYDPEFALAHNGLGLIYHALGKYDEAIEHYQLAIKADKKLSEARNNLAAVYIDQGKFKEAIPLLEEALADIFYNTPYLAEGNLGWAYYKLGDTEKGVNHTKKAIILNPNFCVGFRNLGAIYDETNDREKSLRYYKKYAEKCPDAADAHYRLGLTLAKTGETEEAKLHFAECQKKAPEASDMAEECDKLLRSLNTKPE